jgi:hypothetical protein
MKPRDHIHPISFRWFKYIFSFFAFGFPLWMLVAAFPGVYPNKAISAIELLCLAPICTVLLLVAAYFYQDVSVDDDGLLIEFLWKKFKVKWADIIEIKPIWVFRHFPEKLRPAVVIVNGLTPIHRVLGVLYGLSIQPGFVIYSSISDFQVLKDNIRKHINARKNQ